MAPIITITRQYGSGGSAVAKRAADALGWTLIDNEFVARGALHVYVIAPREFRLKLAIERLGVDPAKAEKVLDDTDRQRDQYVKANYGRHRQDPLNYDMVLNTGRLGLEGAADLIVSEVKRRGWR